MPDEPPYAVAAMVLPRRRVPVLPLVLLTLVALLIGVTLAGRIIFRALEARFRREQCAAQLHKISVALQNYADQNSAYPPAIIRDAQGRPLHSWRVLILPHLGADEEELHKEYHYDEPWNGSHNRQLANRMPPAFRCPEDPGAQDSRTSYLGLVDGATDEFAAYPTTGNAPPTKPPLTAYLVVETAESGVGWMEPKDIALDNNSNPSEPLPAHFGYHVGGALALDADGSTIVLADDELAKAIVAKPSVPPPAK